MAPLRYAVAFACIVDFIWFLNRLNTLARNGRFSKKKIGVDKKDVEAEEGGDVDDVVVVTGGSSGLGGIVAEILALRGISVAILDVKKPQMEGNYAITYYECDVSDPDQVQRASKQITQDVKSPSPRNSPLRWPFTDVCVCV